MSIKIHHGAPGTYKTSGAMGDDFLREAREGRVIVTNVRGVSRERCFEVFDDLPASFDVIWVDDKTEEGREKLRTWFHWVPKGAFLFIDEAQDIWPRSWRDADIKKLDYPGGLRQATKDDRPFGWEQAWDKHRHWNWDLVLTTPNIKKLRDDLRGVADGAYKHKDLALLGWKGRYIEGFHSAEDNGTSSNDFYSITKKKVPSYVWKLYDSTATGKYSHTKSGLSIFKNPKILFLLAILVGSVAFSFRGGAPASLLPGGLAGNKAVARPSAQPVVSDNSLRNDKGSNRAPAGGADVKAPSVDRLPDAVAYLPFQDGDPVILGTSSIKGRFRYHIDLGDAYVTSDDFQLAGYKMEALGSCAVRFSYGAYIKVIRCGRQGSTSIKAPAVVAETKAEAKT